MSLVPQCNLKMTALEIISDMVNDEMAAKYISQVLVVIHNFNTNSNAYDNDYPSND